ncbi:MAG: GNAT family N-acetyltransferase [Deinococcales bacterium]
MNIRLAYLADYPEYIEPLAHLHHQEWGSFYENWTFEIALQELLEAKKTVLPLTLIALEETQLLGSVSLIEDDWLKGFEHLSPWLASLFVLPAYRGKGVGKALVKGVLREARALHPQVYLFNHQQQAYYQSLGWQTLTQSEQQGKTMTVMVFKLR